MMTYQQAINWMMAGDAVQRDAWPADRMIGRGEDGVARIYEGDGTGPGTAYTPTTEDAASTDWCAVA